MAAAAPFACLSRYRMSLYSLVVVAVAAVAGRIIFHRQPMDLMVHFLPTRVVSVTPWAILLQLSSRIVVSAAIAASLMSMSWNFSSPPVENLP